MCFSPCTETHGTPHRPQFRSLHSLPFSADRPSVLSQNAASPSALTHSRQTLLHWPGRTGPAVRQSGGRTCTGRGACPAVRQSGSCAPRMFRFRPLAHHVSHSGTAFPACFFLSPESITPLRTVHSQAPHNPTCPRILQVRKKRTERDQKTKKGLPVGQPQFWKRMVAQGTVAQTTPCSPGRSYFSLPARSAMMYCSVVPRSSTGLQMKMEE